MLKISLRRLTLIGYPSMPYLLSPIIFSIRRDIRRIVALFIGRIIRHTWIVRITVVVVMIAEAAILHLVDSPAVPLVAVVPPEISRITRHDGIERISTVFLFTEFTNQGLVVDGIF